MGFQFHALKLVAACVIVYILQLMYYPVIDDTFSLITNEILIKPWTLVTSIFLHSTIDSSHLIFNMIALALFGSILERLIGGRKFLIVFFLTGIAASIGSLFFYSEVLGASGAIMGIIGCLAIIRPKMMVWTPIGVPLPMIMAAGIWAFIDFTGYVSQYGNVAYVAHLAGLYAGLMIGLFWRKWFKQEKTKKVIDEKEIDKWENQYMKH